MLVRWLRRKLAGLPDPPVNMVPCPFCGEQIKQTANFCRHCGASEEDGWSDDDTEGYAEEDDFDYDEFVQREFGSPSTVTRNYGTVVIVLIICAVLLLLAVQGF